MFSLKQIRSTSLALAFAAAATLPLNAASSTDYDHNANFRSYKTFSFYKVDSSNPLDDERIKTEMTADLQKAGMQMVPSGGDINITAFAGVHDQKEYNTFYDGLGGGGYGWRGWGGWGGGWGGQTTTTEQTIPVGTLLIDMYDNNTHQLVWRGRTTDSLSNNSDKNTKKLNKEIDHMLNGFPPKSKG